MAPRECAGRRNLGSRPWGSDIRMHLLLLSPDAQEAMGLQSFILRIEPDPHKAHICGMRLVNQVAAKQQGLLQASEQTPSALQHSCCGPHSVPADHAGASEQYVTFAGMGQAAELAHLEQLLHSTVSCESEGTGIQGGWGHQRIGCSTTSVALPCTEHSCGLGSSQGSSGAEQAALVHQHQQDQQLQQQGTTCRLSTCCQSSKSSSYTGTQKDSTCCQGPAACSAAIAARTDGGSCSSASRQSPSRRLHCALHGFHQAHPPATASAPQRGGQEGGVGHSAAPSHSRGQKQLHANPREQRWGGASSWHQLHGVRRLALLLLTTLAAVALPQAQGQGSRVYGDQTEALQRWCNLPPINNRTLGHMNMPNCRAGGVPGNVTGCAVGMIADKGGGPVVLLLSWAHAQRIAPGWGGGRHGHTWDRAGSARMGETLGEGVAGHAPWPLTVTPPN